MLPRLQVTTSNFTLPVSKQKVTYRPFTVKEEKILLMANESQDSDDMMNAFRQVITNCVVEQIDVGKLPMFDLELLFLLLRIVSVSNIAEFNVRDGEEFVKVELNLREVVDSCVKNVLIPSKQIKLSDDLGVVMHDVTLDSFEGQQLSEDLSTEDAFKILGSMIDKVFDAENVYDAEEAGEAEVIAFLESFTGEAVQKLYEYINTVPRVKYTLKYKNKAGEAKELELQGLADFFQYVLVTTA